MRRRGRAFRSVRGVLGPFVGSGWHRRFRFLMLRGAPPKPTENSDERDVAHNRKEESIPIISHDSFPLLAQRQSGDLFEPRDGGLVFGEVLPVLFIEVQYVEERGEHRL